MGLETICIRNYKCIRDYKIALKQMNLLLGENGSGKTNILSAIVYFYENMISQNPSYQVFDENNPLNDKVEITLTYDLSRILIRSRRNRKRKKEKYLTYYKKIEGIAENGKISLTLSQVKGGRITWNHGIDTRKILYHLYPLYQLDAREINLIDWEELWGNIGDLIKMESENSEKLHEDLADVVKKTGGELQDKLGQVEQVLKRLQVMPLKFSVSEFAANMAKMYYNGREFSFMGHRLDSFSNGTNSYNYTCLLLYVLSAMGHSKMKEPVLLMDEPEISLHFHMIDELTDVLLECVEDISVIATTHSPRLVKNILVKEQRNATIYQVYKRGDYSYLCLLNMFEEQENREKYFLTEQHANAFFAKILVLVEGETELELLQNPYLRQLFPILKQAEIIKGMSDKVVYRIVDTNTRHYNVPMAALLDMDKILEWDSGKNQMKWKKDYQFVGEKEKYLYGRKRNETVNRKKRIRAMCQKCKFSYRLPFYGSEDNNYRELIQTVQEYYAKYHIFAASTTIEGVLINEENYQYVIEYLKSLNKWKDIEKAYQLLYNKIDKVNFLRLLFHGKSDFLLKFDGIIKRNPKMYPQLKAALRSHSIAKTSWVSSFLHYYFAQTVGVPSEKLTQKKFSEWCEAGAVRGQLKMQFVSDFPELYRFIDSVTKLYYIQQ